MSFFLLLLIAIINSTDAISALHETYNFVLPAKQRQCFYENFNSDSPTYKVEVFILSGGAKDVLLAIHGPLSTEEIMEEEFEKPILQDTVDSYKEIESDTLTYTNTFKPHKEGAYAFCLDNRKSYFSAKEVQIDVRPFSSLEKTIETITENDLKNSEVDSAKIQESLHTLNSVYEGLTRIQLQQQRDRHRLSLHSEINTNNYTKVFAGSIFETAVFIAAAIFQIYFIRRWFAAKNPSRAKAWA